ncbi:hypothetical protein NEAUS04_1107 [Nematocida ausubeli]|nr:hypothetical protein NEAUS05_1399 [Nematocida ausubeli]KAI5162708.1 hypothetical protein NEAUS04_1107 [Nematocida ausubeli]
MFKPLEEMKKSDGSTRNLGKRLRSTNLLLGIITSVYGNLDIGKPYRLRSLNLFEFLSRFYHLTHVGLLLTTVTLCMGLVHKSNSCPGQSSPRGSFLLYNIYLYMLALTIAVETFIPVTFWVLWHIDKSLVVNTASYVGNDSISFFFNLCMHGLPTIFLLVEFFCIEFFNTPGHYALIFGFFIGYLLTMYLCYVVNGYWPYGVVTMVSGVNRIGFFAVCFLSICFMYYSLIVLNRIIWRKKKEFSSRGATGESDPSAKKR